MREGQSWISRDRGLKFSDCVIASLEIELRFSNQQMYLRRVASDLPQLGKGAIAEILAFCFFRRNIENVQVGQIARFLRPYRLQGIRGFDPAFCEEVALPQQKMGLHRSWLSLTTDSNARNRARI